MRYSHMVDATWIEHIWFDITTSDQDDLCSTLEEMCRATACRIDLTPPVITHRMDDMIREVHFDMRDYAYLP